MEIPRPLDPLPEQLAPAPPGLKPRETWLSVVALVAASLVVYGSALGHSFLVNWDDLRYVVENPIIRGFSFEHLVAAFSRFYLWNYAPLHLISYMVDYELWGLRASGFILTNVLLHTANGVLFFLLLGRLYPRRPWTVFAAALFLLHPVQVESVVWVSQRKNVLAMLFFLLSFHLYVSYSAGTGRRALWYWLSVVCSFLGLLAKSVVVILPVALFLYDLCFQREKRWKSLLADKVPFLLASAAFSLLALVSQSVELGGGRTSYHGGSLYATFLTMLPVLLAYLRLVFWPAGLSAYYSPPVKTAPDLQVLGAGLVCIALVLAGVWLFRRRRDRFFWFALFFLGLVPVSQLVPLVTLMNDRYLYFPMLGASAFVAGTVLGGVEWAVKARLRRNVCLLGLGGLAVAACAGVTLQRVPVWKDSAALWSDAVTKAPRVPLVHDALGEGLLDHGRVDEAIEHLLVALRLWPLSAGDRLDTSTRNAIASTYNNLGTAYGMKGLPDRAADQFAQALSWNPTYAKAYFNMGNAFMHLGLPEQALRCFDAALRLEPGDPLFAANLAATRRLLEAGGAGQSQGPTGGTP